MSVIKTLHEGGLIPTGIIALQTNDAKVFETISCDAINPSSYEKMMEYFNSRNFEFSSLGPSGKSALRKSSSA